MRKIILFCSLVCFGPLLDEQRAWSQGGPDFNTLETIRIREAFQKARSPAEIKAVAADCFKVVQYFNSNERELYLKGFIKAVADNSTLSANHFSKKLSDLDDRTELAFNRICHP